MEIRDPLWPFVSLKSAPEKFSLAGGRCNVSFARHRVPCLLLATVLLRFVHYPAIGPKFLEEISTFFHVVSTVAC